MPIGIVIHTRMMSKTGSMWTHWKKQGSTVPEWHVPILDFGVGTWGQSPWKSSLGIPGWPGASGKEAEV